MSRHKTTLSHASLTVDRLNLTNLLDFVDRTKQDVMPTGFAPVHARSLRDARTGMTGSAVTGTKPQTWSQKT